MSAFITTYKKIHSKNGNKVFLSESVALQQTKKFCMKGLTILYFTNIKIQDSNLSRSDLDQSMDQSGPRHCDFDANFLEMAQKENCMGSIWRKEIKFGADCQVHRVT